MIAKKVWTRLALYLIYFACLLIYTMFHGSKYDWMDQGAMESLSQEPSMNLIEDPSGNRSVFRGVVFVVVLGVQLAIMRQLSKIEASFTGVLLCIVMIAFW